MQVAGIDEAGRGPVIGPLVMAAISIAEDRISKLKEIGVKDSKQLLKSQREDLFRKILMIVDSYKIITIPPDKIDEVLADEKTNLNILEAKTTSELINHLVPDKVFLDLPDKNPDRYKDYVREDLTNKNVEIIAEFKADVNYAVVSAASILAKVTRDRYISLLKEQFWVRILDLVIRAFPGEESSDQPPLIGTDRPKSRWASSWAILNSLPSIQ